MLSPRNSSFGTSDVPLLFLLGWRTLGLPGGADSVKFCALLDRAGEPEGRRTWGNSRSQVDCPRASQAKWSPFTVLEECMQQPQLTTETDIAEVRTVTGASTCNQLLAEGWVLLGVLPLTRVAEMGARQPTEEKESKRIEDTQRYVRRLVGYVVGKKRE
jgi:hypothetical protein